MEKQHLHGRSRKVTKKTYAKGPASLSFVCEPLEGLVLLCIDTNKYKENLYLDKGDEKNYNQTSGRIRPATLT